MKIEKMNLPKDLSHCSARELYKISREIRQMIIDVVSKNGGHLASNLGVVELSVAIHAALNSPEDKTIWDVGHQAYAHKILTGRLKQFPTIRQYKGLSGFPRRSESQHDIFGAGHASTSLSAALGIAKARDLDGKDFAVLSVIGDASLSSGEAFEAINNIKTVKGPFIIILNDNEMSISKPVGVLSEHITSIRYNRMYRGFKKEVERLLLRLPQIGKPLAKSIDKLLKRTKHLLINYVKVGVIYEEFGIRYLGPIDATNIPHIMGAIRYAKTAPEPVLIHVLSKKGQGYKPAENDPTRFHGCGVFDPKTGKIPPKSSAKTYTRIFSEQIVRLGEEVPEVVAITAAMAEGTGLSEFEKKFPERFIDVGISEEHAVTFAGGLSVGGKIPVVSIYSTFMQRAFDQIIHDIALQNLHVVFMLDRAGIVGEDGPTHHGVFDLSYLRMIPNMTICAPKDAEELKQMMNYAVKHHRGPIAIRYPKTCAPENLSNKVVDVEIGRGEWLIKTPKARGTVVAIGSMVETVLSVVEDNKLPVNLINARFLKPLDTSILKQATKGNDFIYTIEEGVKKGGLFGAVSEWIHSEGLSLKCIGSGIDNDHFVEHGPRDQLLDDEGLSKSLIRDQLKSLLG